MSENNHVSFVDWLKHTMDNYADFLNTMRVFKFILFLILVSIVFSVAGDLIRCDFSNLNSLFIFVSIGVKAFNTRKIKTLENCVPGN
jgi:hypothetical protein